MSAGVAFGILLIGSCIVGALVVTWAMARRQTPIIKEG